MATTEYRQHRFSRPEGATEVFLVRHGESAAVVPGVPVAQADGHDDPPLAPEGLEQAERVGERLADQRIDAIYVTPLRRTHETAAPLAARLALTPVVEPDLREVHLGEWEGGAFRRHVAEGHPLAVRMFAEQRWDVIPGAEPTEAFGARLRAGLGRIVAAHPDQRVVVVAHGGVIGELVRQAVDGGQGFAFVGADNGSITHLVVHGDRWTVRRFNDTAHLGGFDLDPEPDLPEV
jgi:2,3-bisphosphoglycerate-dependent phosphoglycerate mutase